jgi:hypothetical protein
VCNAPNNARQGIAEGRRRAAEIQYLIFTFIPPVRIVIINQKINALSHVKLIPKAIQKSHVQKAAIKKLHAKSTTQIKIIKNQSFIFPPGRR